MKTNMPKSVPTPQVPKTTPVKNPPVKIRGCGAATKGTMARGPMA